MGDTASFGGTSNCRLRVGLAAPPQPREPCLPPPPPPPYAAFSPLSSSPQNKQQGGGGLPRELLYSEAADRQAMFMT